MTSRISSRIARSPLRETPVVTRRRSMSEPLSLEEEHRKLTRSYDRHIARLYIQIATFTAQRDEARRAHDALCSRKRPARRFATPRGN